MKKKLLLFMVSLLLVVTSMMATTTEVATTLSTTETVVDDSWKGHLQLTQSQLATAVTGDKITVNVTARSSNTAISPLVDFRNGSWTSLTDYTYVRSFSLPATVSLALTDAMISAINGHTDGVSSGLIITGCGVTFTDVKLVKSVTLIDGTGKGNAVTNLWTGNEAISWVTGSNNSVKLESTVFSSVTAGMKLRMSYSGLAMNGVGRILHNWTGFDGLTNAKLTTDYGNYYEYTLTDAMITSLQADGLRVSGTGYTLTAIDLIDPNKEYNILSQYDLSDIKAWEVDETPNMTITLTNAQTTSVTTTVKAQLMTDMWTDYKDYSEEVTLAAGETKAVDLNFKLDPGFYRLTVNANNTHVCTYMIGYNPTAIVSPDDAQPDFWTFWDGWKEKLAAIDMNAQLTELTDYSTANRKVYEVKLQSAPDVIDGNSVSIWGYYAEPVGEGTYPAIIRYQGTDNGTGTPVPMGGDDNIGWSELIISTRGQMLSRVKAKAENTYVDYYGTDGFYAYHYGDQDEHYYRAAYLDCVRAIDFIASREKTDANNIFAAGGSQGGCYTYVAAGLDDRLKAIAPSITGHADFPHTKKIVSWPTNIFSSQQATLGWTDAQIDAFNSYFDTKNFASRITCPVITNFSLQDHTDGPHLNIAPYNLLTHVPAANKAYSINSFKAHATANDWTTTYMNFFHKYVQTNIVKRSTTVGNYGTICMSQPAVVFGATLYRVTGKNAAGTSLYITAVGNNALEAGQPYIFKATSTTVEFDGTGIAVEASTNNGLVGVLVSTIATADTYVLSGNKWLKAITGSLPTIGANHAYLDLSQVQNTTSGASSYKMDVDSGIVTGIDSVKSTVLLTPIGYNLLGQHAGCQHLGLMIKDSKKILVK